MSSSVRFWLLVLERWNALPPVYWGCRHASHNQPAFVFDPRLESDAARPRCAFTDENANRLARTVIKLFDQGLRDEEVIASKAAEQEKAVSDIARQRDGREVS